MFELNEFIGKYVTKREKSMFQADIDNNKEALFETIQNKTVLVIGGAGSIGSSFIKAILPFRPKTLVVVDVNENGLAELTRDLRSTKDLYVPDDYIPYPMDYSSSVFQKMFRSRGGFDIVANFSAHKHVRSEKDIFSIEAMLRNNVLNAKRLLDLLVEIPPRMYFCVSTDKAANPVNIMGASKRVMEDLIFSYSDKFPVKTARFANVAFSNGSLPISFIDRMNKKQPICAPSDVQRYFVSLEESGQICMLSCMLGNNREIFFPKLNEAQMMTFDKIATAFINEHGYKVLECKDDAEAIEMMNDCNRDPSLYPVHYSGSNTSGEKAYEEFYTDDEKVDMMKYNALGVVLEKKIPDVDAVNSFLNELAAVFDNVDVSKSDVVKVICRYLPNFEHVETGLSLDSKM